MKKRCRGLIIAVIVFVVGAILMSRAITYVANNPESADKIWFVLSLLLGVLPGLFAVGALLYVFIRGIVAKRRLENWSEYWKKKMEKMNRKNKQ